jgi:hypothetical protein
MPLYGAAAAAASAACRGDSVDIGMAMGPMGHQAAYGGYLLVVNNMMVNDD